METGPTLKFPLALDYFDVAPPKPSSGVSFYEGGGILSGRADWDEIRRQSAEQHKQEVEAAERAAELRHRCAMVDQMAGKYLARKLNHVRVKASPRHLVDFKKFREYCVQHDWPFSPTVPHAIYEYMVEESEKGADHVAKLAKSISTVHRAAGHPDDPTQDDLVKALLLQVKQEEENSNPN